MQTGPNVKVSLSVPRAEVAVPLPAMLAFVAAHFSDLRLLQAYLERATGAEVHEEQLVMGKVRTQGWCLLLCWCDSG